ncbi:MAG TPA: hypothetical protein V6D28_25095 [Leptolyngbyaceae cyanobacterium]
MKSTLHGFEITDDDLKNLTGLNKDEVLLAGTASDIKDYLLNFVDLITHNKLEEPKKELTIILLFLLMFLYLLGTLSVIIFYRFLPNFPALIGNTVIFLAAVGCTLQVRLLVLKKYITPFVGNLVKEVNNFNLLVEDLRLNEKPEEEMKKKSTLLMDREKVVEAIELAKYDLVRALILEKKFREDKSFVDAENELLASNLSTLQQLRVIDTSSEYELFLGQIVELAVRVQAEMIKLHNCCDLRKLK